MNGLATIVASVVGSYAALACVLLLSYAHYGWETLPEELRNLAQKEPG
jgi:hypothetical protein